ncbi:MAG TPA: glutaredoxin family protein [Dehalococcoidales bacterium]
MTLEHVSGKKTKRIVIYALSTCPWCRRTKNLLNELGVEYYFTDVDLASDKEKQTLLDTVRKWNPACSFPTIVIADKKCIIGFKEDEIREAIR